MASRMERLNEARRCFNIRSSRGHSLFQFNCPQPVSENECESFENNRDDSEGFIDTLKPRIIMATVLFLIIFGICQFNVSPGLDKKLSGMISDNQIVEDVYTRTEEWIAVLKQL